MKSPSDGHGPWTDKQTRVFLDIDGDPATKSLQTIHLDESNKIFVSGEKYYRI